MAWPPIYDPAMFEAQSPFPDDGQPQAYPQPDPWATPAMDAAPQEMQFAPDVLPPAGSAESQALQQLPPSDAGQLGLPSWLTGQQQPLEPQVDAISGASPFERTALPANEQAPPVDVEAQSTGNLFALRATQEKEQAEGELNLARQYREQLASDTAKTERENAANSKAEAAVGQAWNDVSKQKVDPKRFWNSLSGAGKAGAMIGAMIGGFLSARQQRGGNQFMESFNQRVSEDIAAQEANMANLRASAAGKQSVYGQMLDRTGNVQAARQLTTATLYDAGMREVTARAGLYKSQFTQEESKLALVGLQKGRDAALAGAQQAMFESELKVGEFRLKEEQQAETRRNNRAQTGLGYGRLSLDKEKFKDEKTAREAEAEAKAAGKGLEFPIYGSSGPAAGPVGYASGQSQADQASGQLKSNAELVALYKRGKELLKDDYATDGTDRRLQQEAWNAAWQSARFRASGRTDAPSNGELVKWGIDPSRILGDNEVALDESYNTARTSGRAQMKAAGVTESALVNEELADLKDSRDAKGNRQSWPKDSVLYMADDGTINNKGDGSPLSEEDAKAAREHRANFEKSNRPVPQRIQGESAPRPGQRR